MIPTHSLVATHAEILKCHACFRSIYLSDFYGKRREVENCLVRDEDKISRRIHHWTIPIVWNVSPTSEKKTGVVVMETNLHPPGTI